MNLDPDAPYLVTWPDGSKRLLFGQRIIDLPVSANATIARLVPEPDPMACTLVCQARARTRGSADQGRVGFWSGVHALRLLGTDLVRLTRRGWIVAGVLLALLWGWGAHATRCVNSETGANQCQGPTR